MTPNKKKYITLSVFAWLCCVGVPIVVTLSYFPLWVETSETATVGGVATVCIMLSVIPLVKYFKQLIKSVYACVIVWGIFLVLMLALQAIIVEMIVVAYWGVGANVVASALFVSARRYKGVNTNE